MNARYEEKTVRLRNLSERVKKEPYRLSWLGLKSTKARVLRMLREDGPAYLNVSAYTRRLKIKEDTLDRYMHEVEEMLKIGGPAISDAYMRHLVLRMRSILPYKVDIGGVLGAEVYEFLLNVGNYEGLLLRLAKRTGTSEPHIVPLCIEIDKMLCDLELQNKLRPLTPNQEKILSLSSTDLYALVRSLPDGITEMMLRHNRQ